PWPGSLPGPLPATVFGAGMPVAVLDADGDMIAVDARGLLTADPVVLEIPGVGGIGGVGARRRGIRTWAGPWPVIERGWDPARARWAHRFQVVDDAHAAWLLVCEEGGWRAEGVYD
ncbi:MAG: DNA polymerase Y family protein, partial [Microbacterium sp.]